MFKNLSTWVQQKSTGWVTLFCFVIFSLFLVLVLPRQAASTKVETGVERSPDMSFFYSAQDLYSVAQAYGEQGRAAYIRARFTFDLVWPLVYMVFLTTAISWSYQRAFKPASFLQLANLAPILGMLFDYLENLATSLVMGRYPAQTMIVDNLAPVFTLIKWILVGSSFVLLVIGLVFGSWKGVLVKQK